MACVVLTDIAMAYTVMVCVVIAYIDLVFAVVADIVMAYTDASRPGSPNTAPFMVGQLFSHHGPTTFLVIAARQHF